MKKDEFYPLEKKLQKLYNTLEKQNLLTQKKIKSNNFLLEANKCKYMVTLHDVEFYKPICINNSMKNFYGFENNWLKNFDYLYYLKTIHLSSYNTLLNSISFFKKDAHEFLNLEYKLLYKNETWKNLVGSTKVFIRKKDNTPKYAISILNYANSSSENTSIPDKIKKLTKREKQIITLLTAGLSKKEIATKNSIATSTVETHVKNIYKKLGINKISELTAVTEKYLIK